jgi:uncharacterized protein YjbI with pentapeptide repeats
MLAAVVAVAVTALIVTVWLLAIAGHAQPGTDRANARLDAVRTGLAAGAGAGAAVGLMLAFRRQHHQEIATELTDLDAAERRITELYTKAVEQLGSAKAPVRLGGLYALERLAQDTPAHRQTIVNVICAYLRMPFPAAPPGSDPAPGTGNQEPPAESQTDAGAEGDAWQQEKQVRLTAQRILAEHLQAEPAEPPGTRFWPGIRLDLIGATLIDFALRKARPADVYFSGVTFVGIAPFDGTTFTGAALFSGATFTSTAFFQGATFTDKAWFAGVAFTGEAWFGGATFTGEAYFRATTFTGAALFTETTFTDAALFTEATFTSEASFREATFTGAALFDGANANRWSFHGSRVLSTDAEHAWPSGWCLARLDSGEHTVVRTNTGSGS